MGVATYFYWCTETSAWIIFRGKKIFFLKHMILVRMFLLFNILYLNMFIVKVNGNHHSSNTWVCVSETYWLIYITVWMLLRRKLFYFNDLIVFRTFSLLKFQYSKIITLISNGNYHSLKTWGWEWTLPSFFNTDWLLFRRKLLYFNDLTPNPIFLLLKFQ